MVEPQLFPGQGGTPPDTRKNVGAPSPMLQGVREQVSETASRLSVLEERTVNLQKKTQLTEQGLLEYERDTRVDLKALTQRLTELARKVEDVREKIDAMAGELGTVVKKHEFTVLERYMDMWEPLQFVTRHEAKMLLQDAKKK
ncbi:hypothetical protein GOV07_04860 [Candidatus Woesearchaeota archaeon]|nr:hypothetical protein [Candidatus Woesearchaeota archaeon]